MSPASSRAPGAPSGHGRVPPGTCGEPPGDLRDPPGGEHPGPGDELGAPAPTAREVEGGRDPGNRGDRHEGRGEQVGEHAHDADRALEQDDERCGHRLRRDRDGERGSERGEPRGSRAPMASPHGRVKSSRPRVASDDSANPKERASHGSRTSTRTIAAPSTGGAGGAP